jgi:MGT family glycosyltransferase
VVVIASGAFVRPEVVGAPLHQIRAELGLPADPDMTMLHRYLVLNPVPPSFRDPAYPLPPTAHSIRPPMPDAMPAPKPAWATAIPGAPVVYFTLGTVFNLESGDLFGRVLAGLRDLPVNVIATTGSELDPVELGPQPPHIHIERYVAQADVLPHCDLCISHGGSGSVIGALAHALPMVLIPMGADQSPNARRCKALGAGRTLHALDATPDDVREAVEAVLHTPSYRANAARLRDELAALPDSAYAVTLLERLAATRAPITA